MNEDNGKGESKSLAELAVHRRQEVRRKTNLCDAGKLLFDDLTDLCFLDKYSVGFGVVRVGKPLLAERLGCSVPTITRAQRALMTSELWTKTGWYEGHEITIWFLRGIASGQLEFDQFTQGITRPARTRVAPRVSAVRNGHGQFRSPKSEPETLDFHENTQAPSELTVHPGQSCRVATVNPAVATTAELTGGNRQNRPSGHGRTDRGERSELTGVNGQNHRNGHGRIDLSTRSGLTVYKKDLDTRKGDKADSPPEDRAFQDWIKSLDGLFPGRLHALESKIKARLQTCRSELARAGLKRQLKAVQDKLLPPVPDEPPKPKPARQTPKPVAPSPEEVLEGAHYLVSIGKENLLQPQQKAALAAAG